MVLDDLRVFEATTPFSLCVAKAQTS